MDVPEIEMRKKILTKVRSRCARVSKYVTFELDGRLLTQLHIRYVLYEYILGIYIESM